MSTLRHDLRQARRMLLRNPLFTFAAVLTLALGIGLNTAVFSAVNALLLRPLPGVADQGRLVHLFRTYPGGFLYGSSSIPHFRDVRDRNRVFEGVAAWNLIPLSLSVEGRSERVLGQMVSAAYFEVLGVSIPYGRGFLPEEEHGPGAHAVAVISDQFWQTHFGGARDVIGRTVRLNGREFTIVGIAPRGFRGSIPFAPPALWAPLTMQGALDPGRGDMWEARGNNFLNLVARLRPGVSAERAEQALNALNTALAEEHRPSYEGTGMLVMPQSKMGLHPQFRSVQVAFSALIMAVVALLLLLACVNVANLFLARAGERRREMAVRLGLGARRWQLVRQLLTESLAFALVSGAAGLLIAGLGIRLANAIRLPIGFPVDFGIRLDPPVLLFTLGVAAVAGLLFGLAPAVQATRTDLVSGLKGESSAGTGGSRSRLSQSLVVAQVALSVLLLASAGLFVRNLQQAARMPTGFQSDHLLLAAVDPALQGYEEARMRVFYRELTARIRALPGVSAFGLGEQLPLGLGSQQRTIGIPGYEPRPDEHMNVDYNIVAPGYFEAMGIPLRAGRSFSESDDASAPRVLVINEHLAERFWPGQSPLGRRVNLAGSEAEVVGVVPTGKYRSLGESPLDYMYLAHAQFFSSEMTLHVRTRNEPIALAAAVRGAIRELDSDLPVYDVRTMENHLGFSLLPARLAGTVLGFFGLLGLVLASIGVYGVVACSVAQRTREIGIRVALGADRRTVLAMVLRQGAGMAGLGILLGVAAGLGASRVIRGLLYTRQAADPVTFGAVVLLLLAVALLASYIPARRAAAVDPMRALRLE